MRPSTWPYVAANACTLRKRRQPTVPPSPLQRCSLPRQDWLRAWETATAALTPLLLSAAGQVLAADESKVPAGDSVRLALPALPPVTSGGATGSEYASGAFTMTIRGMADLRAVLPARVASPKAVAQVGPMLFYRRARTSLQLTWMGHRNAGIALLQALHGDLLRTVRARLESLLDEWQAGPSGTR